MVLGGLLVVGGGLIYGGLHLVSHLQTKVSQGQFDVPEEYTRHEQQRQQDFRNSLKEEKLEQEKAEEALRTQLAELIANKVCDGVYAVGRAIVDELFAVHADLDRVSSDADPTNNPTSREAFLRESLEKRVAKNRLIQTWLAGRSPKLLADLFWNDSGSRLPPAARQVLLAGSYKGNGSGFFISSDGWIITNHHVTDYAPTVDVRTSDGTVLEGKVVHSSKQDDLALIKCDLRSPSWLELDTSETRMGSEVFTVGFPQASLQGMAPKFTDGKISSLSGMRDDAESYQISVPVQPGNSGGALLDTASGRVVGVINAKLADGADNVSYAIKSRVAGAFLESVPAALASSARERSAATGKSSADLIEAAKNAAVLILVK